MSQISSYYGRSTLQLQTSQLLAQLRRTQAAIAETQYQVSTGKKAAYTLDLPGAAAAILTLQDRMNARDQHELNLQFGQGITNSIDQALADATNIVNEAHSVGSSQIGLGADASTRKAQAAVIDSHIQALLDIGNRDYQGVALFGGTRTKVDGGSPVFGEFLGGIRYNGARTNLVGDTGLTGSIEFNSNGHDALAALSTRVASAIDLNPDANAATRVSDIAGATGEGFHGGSILLTVDATSVNVDLNGVDTLGDVVTRINDAINAIDNTAGAVSISSNGFTLTAAGGHTIDIADPQGGKTAGDLGVALSAAGAAVAGGDVGVRLTALTKLSDLGPTIDFAGGLLINQGNQTRAADFSTAQNIQDLQNVISGLGLGLRLEINDAGTGLNLISEVSGIDLSIGENAGTTAADLGLRTFGVDTRLADFNRGIGVSNVVGKADFTFTLHDGTAFSVDIDGATTVNDVLSRINAAASGAGLSVGAPGSGGTQFNLGLSPSGNGFLFEDNTAGASSFAITQINSSLAATDLGINKSTVGASIAGDDVAKVRADSVITHLMDLRNALLNSDASGITVATSALESDLDKLTLTRGEVGARGQRFQNELDRSNTLKLAEKTMMSDLTDADLTEAITKYTQLAQQLQASLQVGSAYIQKSLLDYLTY